MFEFTSDQEQLFQRRFVENYDLPDPVYQQWLKINHPTAQPVQKEPLGQSSEVGDAVSHQRDAFHDFHLKQFIKIKLLLNLLIIFHQN